MAICWWNLNNLSKLSTVALKRVHCIRLTWLLNIWEKAKKKKKKLYLVILFLNNKGTKQHTIHISGKMISCQGKCALLMWTTVKCCAFTYYSIVSMVKIIIKSYKQNMLFNESNQVRIWCKENKNWLKIKMSLVKRLNIIINLLIITRERSCRGMKLQICK